MTIAELSPDTALKALLDGKVKAGAKAVKVYAQGEMPNVGADADYITILYNGVISSTTNPIGQFEGFLALSVNSKLNSNHTVKKPHMGKIVAQCERLFQGKSSQGYFFKLAPYNPITPPTPNNTTGYAATTINVAWHTT